MNTEQPNLAPSKEAAVKATITIHYCRQCNWMLRSSWLCQELLHTFSEEIEQVSLHPDTGGRFEIFAMEYRFGKEKQMAAFLRLKF